MLEAYDLQQLECNIQPKDIVAENKAKYRKMKNGKRLRAKMFKDMKQASLAGKPWSIEVNIALVDVMRENGELDDTGLVTNDTEG